MPTAEPLLKIPFFDRRKRIRRPWTLIVFGLFFLIWPFANYVVLARQFGIPLDMPLPVIQNLKWIQIALMVIPIPVGLGLLMVKKWAWWLFLIFSATLIIYNLVALISMPVLYNFWALAQAVISMSAVYYFTREDISAPFMKVYPRGWRLQKRTPVEIDVEINGMLMRSKDVGSRGIYVMWHDCPSSPGDEVSIYFKLGAEPFQLHGGIVRVDPDGAGIAFRGTSRTTRKMIALGIKELTAEKE